MTLCCSTNVPYMIYLKLLGKLYHFRIMKPSYRGLFDEILRNKAQSNTVAFLTADRRMLHFNLPW